MNQKTKRYIINVIGLLVFICLIAGGIFIYISLSRAGKIGIAVTVVPSDASVVIEGKTYKNKKTIYLEPGDYTVRVKKEGFKTDAQDVTVSSDTTSSIIAGLYPLSDAATTWYDNNQDEYYKLEDIAGADANTSGQEFVEKHPITAALPIQTNNYSVGYKRSNDKKGIVVTIIANEGYREAALQAIRNLGFDPSDYTIKINNYENPFHE